LWGGRERFDLARKEDQKFCRSEGGGFRSWLQVRGRLFAEGLLFGGKGPISERDRGGNDRLGGKRCRVICGEGGSPGEGVKSPGLSRAKILKGEG